MLFVLAAGTQAKESTLVLRIKSDDGRIEFFHHGKRLTDPTIDRLCAEARSRKVDIEFQRDKMTRDDALAAILKEAQCLGASHGPTRIDRRSEPKSSARTHATRRRKAGTPR